MSKTGPGRPRISSLETLVEAACELFLEKGFEETSIVDIARRAGVSRSSFFNYASSKSGLLWAGFDARIGALSEALERTAPAEALLVVFADLAPDALALAFANAEAMGMVAELERESAVRLVRIASVIAATERRTGRVPMAADVAGAAFAGAVMTALRHWSLAGPGKRPLRVFLQEALRAAPLSPG
jgi:AcrR family transcriptional regulator